MIKYRYLGYGVTNSNGVAHLTNGADGQPLSENGYKGTGKGLTQIVASTDDQSHISESSLQSEIYGVLDTLFFDNCTDDSKKSTWFRYNNSVSEPVFDNTGMFVERTETGNGFLVCNSVAMDTKPFGLDFAVEFDVVSATGEVRFLSVDGDWNRCDTLTANEHIKVEFYSNKQVITRNTTTNTYTHSNTGNQGVRFQFVGVGSIKLKNVKVYSI